MKNRLLQEIKLHIVHAMVPAAILIAMLGWSLCAKGSQMASGGVLDKAIQCGAPLDLAKWMLQEEILAGVPKSLRGITLAKACRESRFNFHAEGDCWSGTCKAYGLLQFWPWAESDKYNPLGGIDRADPKAQVRTWLGLSSRQMTDLTRWTNGPIVVAKVRRYCPRQWGNLETRWLVAMVRVNRRPRDVEGHHRCNERPKAWGLLKRWKSGNTPRRLR